MKRSERSAQIAVRTIGNPKCLYHRGEDLLFVCKERGCKESLVCFECINTLHRGHICVELHKEAKLKCMIIRSYIENIKSIILPRMQKKLKLINKTMERNEMHFRKIVKETESLENTVNYMKIENESTLNAYMNKLILLSRKHKSTGSGFQASNNAQGDQWCPMSVPEAPALYNLNVKITSKIIPKTMDSFGSCFSGKTVEKMEDSKVKLSINCNAGNCLTFKKNVQQGEGSSGNSEKEPTAKRSNAERKAVLSCYKKGIKMVGQLLKGDNKFFHAITEDIANIKKRVAYLEKRNISDLTRYRSELQMKHDNLLSQLPEYMTVTESGTNVCVFDTAVKLQMEPELPKYPSLKCLHVKVSTLSPTHLNYVCPVHRHICCSRKDEPSSKSFVSSDGNICGSKPAVHHKNKDTVYEKKDCHVENNTESEKKDCSVENDTAKPIVCHSVQKRDTENMGFFKTVYF